MHPAPRQDVPAGEPYDEIPAVPDQAAVERRPVAAPVVHRDAFPAGGRVDGLEDLQDLVVLALEPGRARGPQPQRERDGLPSADAASRHHAAVVAVDEHVASLLGGAAGVPDERDVLHRVRELLAYLGRVDEQERVRPDGSRPVLQHGVGDGRLQRLVVEVPAQALLRVDRPYVVVDGAHDR